ncbi:MAG TPA: hypothetical protein PLG25_10150 [bacterium]|nr:hypothetical protein [bacterium]HMW34907.1 hypothetical protein [bacterium]HMY36534.1 hypothetical protein [bacterium]HMZ05171.1 hypothetical protein [bacterium]HNB10211.1 hypothetical protein [bacterium]
MQQSGLMLKIGGWFSAVLLSVGLLIRLSGNLALSHFVLISGIVVMLISPLAGMLVMIVKFWKNGEIRFAYIGVLILFLLAGGTYILHILQ